MLSFPLVAMLACGPLSPFRPADSTQLFGAGRTYQYRAVFISPQGDTLSREHITVEGLGQPWKYQKTQTAVAVRYHYTAQDSLTFGRHPSPLTKKATRPKPYAWQRVLTTGVIADRQQVWMHPIRDNQYLYTEVAPYPQVKLDSLAAGGVWHNELAILMGWGAFNGKTKSQYRAVRQDTRHYGALVLPGCWLVQAVAQHSQVGTSYLDFYFHPAYGFVEMHYRFYDGTRISFVLEQATR